MLLLVILQSMLLQLTLLLWVLTTLNLKHVFVVLLVKFVVLNVTQLLLLAHCKLKVLTVNSLVNLKVAACMRRLLLFD